MKNTAIIFLLCSAIQAHAGDMYFYSEWAKYKDTTVKSDFLHSLTECSDEYVFSDGQDYFFKLDMRIQKFLIGVDVALERKQQCGQHVGEEIRTIKDLVGLINTSPLKSANKAPKSALRAEPR